MPKIPSGLHEILGRDYGIIEEPYWGPSILVGTPVTVDSQNMSVKKNPLPLFALSSIPFPF